MPMPTLFFLLGKLSYFVLKQDTGWCRLHKPVYVSDAPCQCRTLHNLSRMACFHLPWPWRRPWNNSTLWKPIVPLSPTSTFLCKKVTVFGTAAVSGTSEHSKKTQMMMRWNKTGELHGSDINNKWLDTCLAGYSECQVSKRRGLWLYLVDFCSQGQKDVDSFQLPQAGKDWETINFQPRGLPLQCTTSSFSHPPVYLGLLTLAFLYLHS